MAPQGVALYAQQRAPHFGRQAEEQLAPQVGMLEAGGRPCSRKPDRRLACDRTISISTLLRNASS